MNKTLIIAATILSLGAGAAFAGDGDVNAQPAQVSRTAMVATHSSGYQHLFHVSGRTARNVYGLFNGGGFAQGGQG